MRRVLIGLMLTMFIFTFLASTGCTRRKEFTAKFPETEPTTPEVATAPESTTAEGMLGEGLSGDYHEGDLALNQTDKGRELMFLEGNSQLKTIYFAYDSSALSPEAKTTLEKVAQWLKENPSANIRIEGNCDERGTTEYNLALGERRALSARRYLISLGIDSDRIFTISYGEEKPAVEGQGESVWKFNRRDDFGISL